MFNVKMNECALCCVELEENFKRLFDEWSSIEMYEDKIRLLQSGRTFSEIFNYAEITSLHSEQFSQRLEKMFLDWKQSVPKSTDSLIYWSDLIAYRKEFFHQSTDKISSSLRLVAEKSLIDIELKLLDVAFTQKKSDAAKQLIKKFNSINSNENILKWNLSIGKYDMIIAENNLTTKFLEGIQKMGKSWSKLKVGVLDHDAVEDFKEIKIETLCFSSEIALKLSTIYQKIDTDSISPSFNNGFKDLCRGDTDSMEIDNEDELSMIHEFMRYSEKSLQKARNIAQEYLDADFSHEREMILGNVYFKLGQYYRKAFVSGIQQVNNI